MPSLPNLLIYSFGFVFMLSPILGIKLCGLEYLKPVDPENMKDVSKTFEPSVRKWLKGGQPTYFVEDAEKIVFPFFEIPVKGGAYWLEDVTIQGIYDCKLKDYFFKFINDEKAFMNYTHLQNVIVKAECFYKVNENYEKISHNKLLCVRLSDVRSKSYVPLTILTRCDGSQYIYFEEESVELQGYPKSCAYYKHGGPMKYDREEFNDGLIRIISELVSRSLNSAYRTLGEQLSTDEYIKKPKKKCGKHHHNH